MPLFSGNDVTVWVRVQGLGNPCKGIVYISERSKCSKKLNGQLKYSSTLVTCYRMLRHSISSTNCITLQGYQEDNLYTKLRGVNTPVEDVSLSSFQSFHQSFIAAAQVLFPCLHLVSSQITSTKKSLKSQIDFQSFPDILSLKFSNRSNNEHSFLRPRRHCALLSNESKN